MTARVRETHTKRIIICCDGTWKNSDNGFTKSYFSWGKQEKLQVPSNVTRFCRALEPESEDGKQQIIYYQAGLGSSDSLFSYLGGYVAAGISEHIREAYAFLANNYEDGDEIFLVGFSRGAFTARSIGGMIGDIGLLTKKGMVDFYPIFKDWENQMDPKYVSPWRRQLLPEEGNLRFGDPAYMQKLIENGITRPNIPVKAIAVWDTVGSLGVPDIGPFTHAKQYTFVNTEIPKNVSVALQALALDDERRAFAPTVWEQPPKDTKTALTLLKQTWFPGVHTNVGGGYDDQELSDLTLAWMTEHLRPYLAFDPTYVKWQVELNNAFYSTSAPPKPPRGWAQGYIASPYSAVDYLSGGRGARTPGEYCATDARTGAATQRRLRRTCEFVHPSVRVRRRLATGLGTADAGKYDPAALRGFVDVAPDEALPAGASDVAGGDFDRSQWKGRVIWVKEKTGTCIVEDRLEGYEVEALEATAEPSAEVQSQVEHMVRG